MTLEEFFILFSTNATKTRTEIAAVEKDLEQLEKKGKKRDEAESKRYDELKKKRKELIGQLKDWQGATDKLADSFTDMATAVGGAAAAFITFNGFKSALVDANRLNVSLQNLTKTYGGITAPELKGLGAAYARSTGMSAETLTTGIYPQLQSQLNAVFGHIGFGQALQNLHEQYKDMSPENAQAVLNKSGLSAVVPLLPWLQSKDFNKSIAEGMQVAGKPEDFEASLKNEQSAIKVQQALANVATQIDTHFSTAVQMFNGAVESFVSAFGGHPVAATGTALGIGLGAGGAGLLGVRKFLGALGEGGVGSVLGGLTSLLARLSLYGTAIWGGVELAKIVQKSGIKPPPEWAKLPSISQMMNGDSSSVSTAASSSKMSNKDRIAAAFRSAGYNDAGVAGWLANAQAESGFNPNASNGSHFGLFQLSGTRRAQVMKALSIDVAHASIEDQVRAAVWEAKQRGLGPEAFANLSNYQAGGAISNGFEIPSTTQAGLAAEAARRGQIAAGYGPIPVSPASAAAAQGSRTYNVHIDEVKIETQATDASGISKQVSVELVNQIRIAMSNYDDGVQS